MVERPDHPQHGVTGLHSYLHPQDHLQDRPAGGGVAAHPYFQRPTGHREGPAAVAAPWTVPALCASYGWPNDQPGGGVIAIVELGGGWVHGDIDQFFGGIGQPSPMITDVSVDGTTNSPGQHVGTAGDPDAEVALDIEVAGAAYFLATGKSTTIRMYWARDITPALDAATRDGCDVCSISWGADEATWGATAGHALEAAALAATDAGLVVLAASGDNDSGDGGPDPANVDLPSSAPHVIGCGGTRKTATSETVWNNTPGDANGHGTGGGYSTLFPMPSWQIGAPAGPGRMVPDVAADADPDTGYLVVVHGNQEPIGGTSAVAPLYAGLFAALGRKLGFLTPELYRNPVCFNDIVTGDNGAYRAEPGPDPCTGIGSPIGTRLARLLTTSRRRTARRLRASAAQEGGPAHP